MPIPVCVPRWMAVRYSDTSGSRRDPCVLPRPGVSPQVWKIVSSLPRPDRPDLVSGKLFQSYITVPQCGIGNATARTSLMCVCAVPNGECHPTPLQDTVDCFSDDIGPVMCPDLAPEFAPGSTGRPSNIMTLFKVLSAYRGFSVSFKQNPYYIQLHQAREN